MKPLGEILPDIPTPSAQRYAATLSRSGLVTPLEQGEGSPFLYSEADAETLRTFSRLRREDRLSVGNALKVLLESKGIEAHQGASLPTIEAHRGASMPIEAVGEPQENTGGNTGGNTEKAPATTPDPAVLALAEELERLKAEGERLQAEAAQRDRTAEDLRTLLEERDRLAADRLREAEARIGSLSEEHRNAWARIYLLEKERKAPTGFLERLLAALSVLLGKAAAVKALPAGEIPEPTGNLDEEKKAA